MFFEIQPISYGLLIFTFVLFALSSLVTLCIQPYLAYKLIMLRVNEVRDGKDKDIRDESLPPILRMWRFCKTFVTRFLVLPLAGTWQSAFNYVIC